MIRNFFLILPLILLCSVIKAQSTFTISDPDKSFKEVKEMIANGRYGMAYPLVKELKARFPFDGRTRQPFLMDDIQYFDIVCRLNLNLDVATEEAELFIRNSVTEPRAQMAAFHLAHFYFTHDDFNNAIKYFNRAGFDNLTNEQIADAKFEQAYSYFNEKDFDAAGRLFDEIMQMPEHKYYHSASYYSGFIAFKDHDYDKALTCFKKVETHEEFGQVVPFYVTEIYYFQGKKDEAMSYAESILSGSGNVYYKDQLKLLSGQMYFEKQDYEKALPLLTDYANTNKQVSKEVLYQLSYCHYQEGNFEKAIEGFKQLSNEKDSMGQNSMYLLGDLYLKAGQKENARNAFQYSAYNTSNASQQRISRFQYAKLCYELGYMDIAQREMKSYLKEYPASDYEAEGREIMFGLLANSNDFKEAYAQYQSVQNPTPAMQIIFPRILYGRAVELINEQQYDKAAGLLRQVTKDPNAGNTLPYAQFWLGELCYRAKNYDECIQNITACRDANPAPQGEVTLAAANYTLGYALFQKDSYAKAADCFSKVASKLSVSSSAMMQDAYCRTADCYYMIKDFGKALNMYDQIINAALPMSEHAMYQKAMIAGVKSSSEKIRLLNQWQRQYPNSSMMQDINLEIASTYLDDEKFMEAVPYLNKVLASDDNSQKPMAYLKLGTAYFNSNKNTEALDAFGQLMEKYPNAAETEEALGMVKDIYVEEGRTSDYVDLMKAKGINVSVSEADSLTFVAGQNKYAVNDCAGAIKGFDSYIKKFPEGAFLLDVLFMRSDCYKRGKDWTKTLEGYKLINEKGPSQYFDQATLDAARICYFELKDYSQAKSYFESLKSVSTNEENTLEALRGLVRSYYQLKDYSKANEAATRLLEAKNISTDDRSIANLVSGKSKQLSGDCASAITSFKAVAAISKSSWGAEARYETGACYFSGGDFENAETAAMSVIKETGAFDLWVTKAYILLGDIFLKQEDFFNAKATYESVARNASILELRNEARQKLDKAIEAEKSKSKIRD